jgi:Endosomal/lysosomal potassium channel TMEM175
VPHAWAVTEPPRDLGTSTPFGIERDPARIVAFSDGVIAIAVTLLVLEIRPPEDFGHLPQGLAALWPSYLAYVVTFMLIGQIWANHHVMFDHIRSADRLVLFLNTVLLMDIAFLPFAASVLAEALRQGHGQRTAVVLQASRSNSQRFCSTSSGGMPDTIVGCWPTPSILPARKPLADASSLPSVGSPLEPCWVPGCRPSAWP